MSFLTIHTVGKIITTIKDRQSALRHDGFLYFNNPIIVKTKDKSKPIEINRVNSNNPFEKDQILPLSFYYLGGQGLIEMLNRLKNNDFYIYKRMEDGKDYKIRLKVKGEQR